MPNEENTVEHSADTLCVGVTLEMVAEMLVCYGGACIRTQGD